MGEHLPCTQGVTGSIPVVSTNFYLVDLIALNLWHWFQRLRNRLFFDICNDSLRIKFFDLEFVVKLLRAFGGCLGFSRRWRTWQAALSLGELQASVDPGISEWGNPLGVISKHRKEPTQGTETSKYLEEKRTIVIPQVVASERGEALKSLYL